MRITYEGSDGETVAVEIVPVYFFVSLFNLRSCYFSSLIDPENQVKVARH